MLATTNSEPGLALHPTLLESQMLMSASCSRFRDMWSYASSHFAKICTLLLEVVHFWHAEYFSRFCRLLIFFQNQLFRKIMLGIPSECQTVWIQTRSDVLSELICVQIRFAKIISRRHNRPRVFEVCDLGMRKPACSATENR